MIWKTGWNCVLFLIVHFWWFCFTKKFRQLTLCVCCIAYLRLIISFFSNSNCYWDIVRSRRGVCLVSFLRFLLNKARTSNVAFVSRKISLKYIFFSLTYKIFFFLSDVLIFLQNHAWKQLKFNKKWALKCVKVFIISQMTVNGGCKNGICAK